MMKTVFLNKTLLLFAIFGAALCLLPLNVCAQWTDDGTSTTTNHNVGIGGAASSNTNLKISAVDSQQGLVVGSPHGNTHIPFIDGRTYLSGAALVFRTAGNTERMRITYNGNVGIGLPNPNAKLQIASGNSEQGLVVGSPHGNTHIPFTDGRTYLSGAALVFRTAGNNERMRITYNGNVGIGTANPGTFKLAVNGTIRAKEIVVEEGWSDYVFYDDYQLPTLDVEEKHIEKNGHLLGFESEENMAGEIQLGDVSKRQQAKIEEMMLHLINMNKALKSVEAKVDDLKTENTELKKQLEERK